MSGESNIIRFIKSVCTQTAVYFGNPKNDGFGGFIFDQPIEIKVRWEGKRRLRKSQFEDEFISLESIMVPTDNSLDTNSFVWLGTLEGFYKEFDKILGKTTDYQAPDVIWSTGSTIYNINSMDEVFQVRSSERVPFFKGTKFVYLRFYLDSTSYGA